MIIRGLGEEIKKENITAYDQEKKKRTCRPGYEATVRI